ncbi:hypothetical protein OGAPHI_005661 [Ogataea philodendri]|uniref:DNA ligase n=1 Tax=Ogataea philodendri TaxID=1378263 RepID=A0A9P8NZN2_9ASCO|nr:uncharacterized protein OGAPHI_005661 [Ogataea philodendri]KAH3662409.1 hypothetical protein OGAPHI_005661 [Ogataea philodendri]
MVFAFDPVESVKKPVNHGPSPKFLDLVTNLFVPLNEPRQGHLAKYHNKIVIEKYLRHYKLSVGKDFLPVAKLVLPARDKARVYMTKEIRLAMMICRILHISKENEDYNKLMGWKKMNFNRIQSSLKFADLLTNIASKRRVDKPGGELSVDQVNSYLDTLRDLADSNTDEKVKVFEEVMDKMANIELRFFFRIVLKINPIRSDKLFLYMWHPNSLDVYDLTHDLEAVFWGLSDPTVRLDSNEKHSRPMYPFTPQRSKRIRSDYNSIAERFPSGFVVEEKYNGERIQLHVEKSDQGYKYRFFSRNAMDYSNIYGSSSDAGSLGCIGPFVEEALVDGIQSCILDGEMVSYDPIKNATLPFSTLKPTALKDLSTQNKDDPRPVYMVFDILHLNGSSLEDYVLLDRKKALKRVVTSVPHRIEVAPFEIKTTGQEIEDSLTNAIEKDLEGLIIKDPAAHYEIGNFISESWIKIKPEYLHEFGENLDLVIVGQIPASKTTYICALRESQTSDKFLTLCGVSNGFSIDDYRRIQQLTAGKWRQWSAERPENVVFGKKTPAMWIDPKESVVIEVKASSISVLSENNYATGSTLYAAYCIRIRDDKNWETTDTLDEFQESSKAHDYGSKHTLAKKRRFKSSKRERIMRRLNDGAPHTESTGRLFENYVICIMTDCIFQGKLTTVSELGQILRGYGATVVRNHGAIVEEDQLFLILADKITMDIAELQQTYNIFKAKWCEDCILMNKLVNLEPSHITACEERLIEQSQFNVDSYGNSLEVDLTAYQFEKLVEQNYRQENHEVTVEDNSSIWNLFIFHGLQFHVLSSQRNQFEMVRSMIEAAGGIVSDTPDGCGYIVVLASTIDELERHIQNASISNTHVQIVSSSFVVDSFTQGVLLDASNYKVTIPTTPRTDV